MEKMGEMPHFAPPDRRGSGGGEVVNEGASERQRFERIFGTEEMQYLGLRDIQRRLVPAMRREQISELILVVYEGESEEILAELTVTDENRSTTLRDEDGTAISLFAAPRGSSSGRRRTGPGGERRVNINAWLREQGHTAHTVTFCPFVIDGEDEAEEVSEHAEDGVDTDGLSVDELADSLAAEEELLDADDEEPGTAKRRKKVRKRPAVRRKRTRQEIKDRKRESGEEEYQEVLARLRSFDAEIKFGDEDSFESIQRQFSSLATLLRTHEQYTRPILEKLQTDPEFENAKRALVFYRLNDGRLNVGRQQRHFNPKLGQFLAADKVLRNLAQRVFVTTENTARSDHHEFQHYRMDRGVASYYQGLFSHDQSIDEFAGDLFFAKDERWVDIGSGTTYRKEDSLLNVIDTVNPDIELYGVDPLYDEEKARQMDVVSGDAGIDEDFAGGYDLLPNYAQRIDLESDSTDRIFSYGVFDKFNLENGSELRAFQEVARLLKEGGTARIFPVRPEFWNDAEAELGQYFDVDMVKEVAFETNQSVLFLKLTRKVTDETAEQSLQQQIEDWDADNPL